VCVWGGGEVMREELEKNAVQLTANLHYGEFN
jgi:hypothetical protein